MTSIPKLTQIVPAPSHYNLTIDWSKHRPSHNQKILKAAKNSFIDQIVRKNKSPEKSSPSPLVYKKEDAWLNTLAKIKGAQKVKELRTTYFEEKVIGANDVPGPKYPLSNPVS